MATSVDPAFITARDHFEKVVDLARNLARYGTPVDTRKTQLTEVGDAAVCSSLILYSLNHLIYCGI